MSVFIEHVIHWVVVVHTTKYTNMSSHVNYVRTTKLTHTQNTWLHTLILVHASYIHMRKLQDKIFHWLNDKTLIMY